MNLIGKSQVTVKVTVVDSGMYNMEHNRLYILVDDIALYNMVIESECFNVQFVIIEDETNSSDGFDRMEAYSTNEGEWFDLETGVSVW